MHPVLCASFCVERHPGLLFDNMLANICKHSKHPERGMNECENECEQTNFENKLHQDDTRCKMCHQTHNNSRYLKMQLLFDDMWLCLTSFDYMGLSAVLPDPFLLTYWRLNYSNPSPTQLPSAEVLASSASSFSPASHVSKAQWRQQQRRIWRAMKADPYQQAKDRNE